MVVVVGWPRSLARKVIARISTRVNTANGTMTQFFGTMLKTGGKFFGAVREISSTTRKTAKLKIATPMQEAALDERCILVDELDRPLGDASKRHCHLVNQQGEVPLHRAFSVFLFDSKGNLLLQKRAPSKITFPGYYTNTCCSHPLMEVPGESEEEQALGIRKAAQRRLNYELGIPRNEVMPQDFSYLTRIHYHSVGDGKWGEHEIDYVLFLQKNKITLDPNPDEVSEIRWISKDHMQDFVDSIDAPLTPWFQLILKHRLPLWWENLHCLHRVEDHASIQRFV